MAHANATTIDQVQIQEQSVDQAASNPMANIWLGLMAVCLGGTLFCTAALVAWPIIAKIVAG